MTTPSHFEIVDDLGQGCKIVAYNTKLYRVHEDMFGEIPLGDFNMWNEVEQKMINGGIDYPNIIFNNISSNVSGFFWSGVGTWNGAVTGSMFNKFSNGPN